MQSKIQTTRDSLAVSEPIPASLVNLKDLELQEFTLGSLEAEIESTSDCTESRTSVSLSSTRTSLPSKPSSLLSRSASPVQHAQHLIYRPITLLLLTSVSYWLSTSAVPLLNKYYMSQSTYKFPYPLCLLSIQLFTVELILLGWQTASPAIVRNQLDWEGAIYFIPKLTCNYQTAKAYFPISLTFLVVFAMSNISLEYLPINLFELFRSPLVLFQLALARYAKVGHSHCLKTAVACVVVTTGYTLSNLSFPLSGFNHRGLLSGLISCFAMPILLSLIKVALPKAKHNHA